MAVNVSAITSVCVYCKTNSNDIAEDFHEIYDEVGLELQLPNLVETYFHIKVKNEGKKYLCDGCVNRLIEIFDLEEHAKEENKRPSNLGSLESVKDETFRFQEDSSDTETIAVEEDKINNKCDLLGNTEVCEISVQSADDPTSSHGHSPEIIKNKNAIQYRNLPGFSFKEQGEEENLQLEDEIEKINDFSDSTLEHDPVNFAENFVIVNENAVSQDVNIFSSNNSLDITTSNENSSNHNVEFFEEVENEGMTADDLYSTNSINSTEDVAINEESEIKSSSPGNRLSETENEIFNNAELGEGNVFMESDMYEELDETLLDHEKTQTEDKTEMIVICYSDENNHNSTMLVLKEGVHKIANEDSNSTVEYENLQQNSILSPNTNEIHLNDTGDIYIEEVIEQSQDEISNDSISLEEEYLIEEITFSEKYDEINLNKYMNEALVTKFQDLHLEWEVKCKLCLANYTTLKELLKHACINEFEEEQQFPCIVTNCEEITDNLALLARHLVLTHYDKIESIAIYGKCPDCQKSFSNIVDFNKHSCCRNIKRKTGSPNYCQYCDMDFQSLKRYVFHMQFHLTNRRPKVCLLCGALFQNSNDFFEHTQYYHIPENAMACIKCDRFFNKKDVFDQHIDSHASKYQYNCTLCPKKYTNKFGLSQHMDIYHNNKANTMKCEHCEREFVNRISYRNHIKCHDEDLQLNAFLCSTCGLITNNSELIKCHVESDEDSPCFSSPIEEKVLGLGYTCENCSFDFQTLKQLKLHRLSKTHNDDLFICGICRQSFKSLRHMRNHSIKHKDFEQWKISFPITRYFVCNIGDCQEFYPIWTTLYYHKKRPHKTQENSIACSSSFICQFCQQICSSKMSLAVHVARSHNNTNVKCSHCKRSFKTGKLLKEHVDRYHVPMECDLCFKKFKNLRNLESHNNMVHLSIKRYFCEYCGKGYFHKSEKDVHEKKVHSETSYKCDLCNFVTTYPESLEIHMDKHNNQLKFKCTICGKKFGRKQLLQCHLKRHLNKKDFVCVDYLKKSGCDASFLTYNLLKRHIISKHPNSTYNINLQKDEQLKATSKNDAEVTDIEKNSYECMDEDDDTTSGRSGKILMHVTEADVEEDAIELVLDDVEFDEQ